MPVVHPSPQPAAPIAPGDLLNDKEAAATLNVSTITLANWRSLKRGPRWVRVGARMVRYRRSDLEAFVAAGDSRDGDPS